MLSCDACNILILRGESLQNPRSISVAAVPVPFYTVRIEVIFLQSIVWEADAAGPTVRMFIYMSLRGTRDGLSGDLYRRVGRGCDC